MSPYLREVCTGIMIHVANAVEKGHKSVMSPTTDTGMVVLALTAVVTLDMKERLMSDGRGKFLTAHLFVKALGPPAFVPRRGATHNRSFFSGHSQKTDGVGERSRCY